MDLFLWRVINVFLSQTVENNRKMRSFLLRKTLSKSQKVMSGNHVEAGKSLTYLLCTKLYLLKDWRRGKISQKHDRISQENWKRGLYIPNKNKFPKNEQCNACNMADLWPFVWAVWSIYSVLYFLSGEMGLGSYGLYTEGVMMGLKAGVTQVRR